MTTAQVLETLLVLLHGEFCECQACRTAQGLRLPKNAELGYTTTDDETW